jgi:hypothetical protein
MEGRQPGNSSRQQHSRLQHSPEATRCPQFTRPCLQFKHRLLSAAKGKRHQLRLQTAWSPFVGWELSSNLVNFGPATTGGSCSHLREGSLPPVHTGLMFRAGSFSCHPHSVPSSCRCGALDSGLPWMTRSKEQGDKRQQQLVMLRHGTHAAAALLELLA